MVKGVNKVVIEADDQERALRFWTEAMGFELMQDIAYGERRWIEVRTPDEATTIILERREGERPETVETLPTSNLFFYCDDLPAAYEELTSRGVEFSQPPIQQEFGWWSLFADTEGNRFALAPPG